MDGKTATACRVDASRERLKLFLNGERGRPLSTFQALESHLTAGGEMLVFAMNAGMFHRDYSPVGLFIADARQTAPLNLGEGDGNFFLKPNGVFLVIRAGAHVLESSQLRSFGREILLATQSGPLLVRGGAIHPRLNAKSGSRLIRNGVCVDSSGLVIFVITEDPMNLHEFAQLFRDKLNCGDALYFDGVVSSVKLPGTRSIQRVNLGPIIAVVE